MPEEPIDVDTATWHTCALTTNRNLYCWGNNANGELGTGAPPVYFNNVPQIVSGLSGVRKVSLGGSSSCVIINHGIKCWGYNLSGELGLGIEGQNISVPTDVAGFSSAVSRMEFNGAGCAIRNGSVYCFGIGVMGNGQPTVGNSSTPVDVVDPSSSIRRKK